MPRGSWSHHRLDVPNENLMLIGRDCHCAPLQGFKIGPTSSQCQDLWSPKSKAWQCVSAFSLRIHTHGEWAWERWRKIWKRDLNRLRIVPPTHTHHHPAPSSPTKFLSEAYSARRALSPMQDIKPGDCRLHLEFQVMAKLLSLGITSDGARSKRVSWRGDT